MIRGMFYNLDNENCKSVFDPVKKNDFAITDLTPFNDKALAAQSLELPHPYSSPAIMINPYPYYFAF